MTSLLTVPAALVPILQETPAVDDATPGWIYPVVFFSLVAVTVLLWLSMRKQLKKIRFPEDERPEDRPDDEQPPRP